MTQKYLLYKPKLFIPKLNLNILIYNKYTYRYLHFKKNLFFYMPLNISKFFVNYV